MQRSPSPDSKLSPRQKAGIVQVEQRLAAAASLLSVVFVAGVGYFIAGLVLLIGSKKDRSER